MPTIHFIPKELRSLSGPQRKLLFRCIREGVQIVDRRTKRTVEVLAQKQLVEYARTTSTNTSAAYGWTGCAVQPGQPIRASGKAWELYREYQELQGFGDAFASALRSRGVEHVSVSGG